MIFDDVIGPVVTAKQIAEERDENAKQLMIALGNKQPASAKEIAELVDKTMPKDPVGIALALEFQIQEKREQVQEQLKFLDNARNEIKLLNSVDADWQEDYVEDLSKNSNEINEAYEDLADLMPPSMMFGLEEGTFSVDLHEAIINNWFDYRADNQFTKALGDASYKETVMFHEQVSKLKRLHEKAEKIEQDYQLHQKAHPVLMAEAEARLREAEERYNTGVGELTVAVGMRSAETKVAESLGVSSTTDVSANVVGVSGTASVGQVRATAEATIAKQRQDYEDFTEKLKEDEQQRQQEDEQAAADEESMAMVKSMIEGLREIHGKPREEITNWKKRHRRTKGGTAEMNNAVASLNDAMPGLINRGFNWGFQKLHGRQMLALRTGIILPRGQLKVRVMDRWEKEGNDLLCFLPDYGKWALLTIVTVSHEQWIIKTVKSKKDEDWTYYEQNTPGVPKNVKDETGVTLEEYAAYYRKIAEHIDSANTTSSSVG